jgi:hypothetical protein
MAKGAHATTLRSITYLVGMLTNVIWGDDWDAEYFVDNSTKMSFGKCMTQIQRHEELFNMSCAH